MGNIGEDAVTAAVSSSGPRSLTCLDNNGLAGLWPGAAALDPGYGFSDTRSLFIVRLSWCRHHKAPRKPVAAISDADQFLCQLQAILLAIVSSTYARRQWLHINDFQD